MSFDEIYRKLNPHPPACTCVGCNNQRLDRIYGRYQTGDENKDRASGTSEAVDETTWHEEPKTTAPYEVVDNTTRHEEPKATGPSKVVDDTARHVKQKAAEPYEVVDDTTGYEEDMATVSTSRKANKKRIVKPSLIIGGGLLLVLVGLLSWPTLADIFRHQTPLAVIPPQATATPIAVLPTVTALPRTPAPVILPSPSPTTLAILATPAPSPSPEPTRPPITPLPTPVSNPGRKIGALPAAEKELLWQINQTRIKSGFRPTEEDAALYQLSMKQTTEMALRSELSGSAPGSAVSELTWGLLVYDIIPDNDLARRVLNAWMASPYHESWLTYDVLKMSAVTVVASPTGYFVSWTYWNREAGNGPARVRRWQGEWQTETAGKVSFVEWLQNKGYLGISLTKPLQIPIPSAQIATPTLNAIRTLFPTPTPQSPAPTVIAPPAVVVTPTVIVTPPVTPRSSYTTIYQTPRVQTVPSAIETAIFEYTNAERRNQGLQALTWDGDLMIIAREHSTDMGQNNFFSHTNLRGEDPTARARRHLYSLHKDLGGGWYSEGIAENIGKMPTGNVVGLGYVNNDPDSVAQAEVKSWMDSPGHRANILNPKYTRLGVGVYYDGLYYVSTQNFW